MNIHTIEALDLSEAWWRCLCGVLADGYDYVIDRGSFVGHHRKELDLAVIRIRVPRIRPLVPTTPVGIAPPTSIEYVEEYLQYLMTSAKAENEQYTYGEDLEPQIPKIIDMFKCTGQNTNQAVMTVGNRNSIDLDDPPCLKLIQCRLRYGVLNFVVYFRSWDLWGGFPSNLAAIQLLKEYMAQEIGVLDGELLAVSPGLHLYDHTWEWAKATIKAA